MVNAPAPSLRLDFDAEALKANWRTLDRMSGSASAGAAVKADAYGLGVERVVPALLAAGCVRFFVAHWSEVDAVAHHAPHSSISVLHGPMHVSDCAYAIALGVKPVLNSLPQVKCWLDAGGGACDLMIDTGINRLGLDPSELSDEAVARLDVDILMSHLACADEDSVMNREQLEKFISASQHVSSNYLSLANSAGIALGPDFTLDATRPGLALYGGVPRPELAESIVQVARPHAAVLQRRSLLSGESVGYNAAFTASAPTEIAIVSLGYADGFLRSWGREGYLRFGDRLMRLLGKVSMDMVAVDCSAAPELREGDWLEVPYSLPKAAITSGLSQYELLTVLGSRFQI